MLFFFFFFFSSFFFLMANIITFRLVSGSGEIKLTKDGNVLLHEMVR